jgi:hypothetical protein
MEQKLSVRISEPFRTTLREMYEISSSNSDVRGLVGDLYNYSGQQDMTFIDKTTKNDTVSFFPVAKSKDIDLSSEFDIWTKCRNEIKIGRMVKKFFGDRYSDKTYEGFVNLYKSAVDKTSKSELFELVSGKDITHWYHQDRYVKGGGTLNGSCMRGASVLEMYEKNPDKVKMLILKSPIDKNLILGRALIWEVDEPKITFMDRIYTVVDSDIEVFKAYAREMGWYCKYHQKYGSDTGFVSPDGKVNMQDMVVYINNQKYEKYPYLDTLRYFNKKDSFLTNKEENSKNLRILVHTDGTAQNDRVRDQNTGNNIYIEDAVYCEFDGAYCHVDTAIWIDTRNFHVLPKSAVQSKFYNKFLLKDDTKFSKYHQDHILTKDCVTYISGNSLELYQDYCHNSVELVDFKSKKYLKKDIVMAWDGNNDVECPIWETIRASEVDGLWINDEKSDKRITNDVLILQEIRKINIGYHDLQDQITELKSNIDKGNIELVDEFQQKSNILDKIKRNKSFGLHHLENVYGKLTKEQVSEFIKSETPNRDLTESQILELKNNIRHEFRNLHSKFSMYGGYVYDISEPLMDVLYHSMMKNLSKGGLDFEHGIFRDIKDFLSNNRFSESFKMGLEDVKILTKALRYVSLNVPSIKKSNKLKDFELYFNLLPSETKTTKRPSYMEYIE